MYVKNVMKLSLTLCLLLCLSSCTMTAINQKGEKVKLRGFGSGKAKFPDGTEIEKGLINFPQIKLDN